MDLNALDRFADREALLQHLRKQTFETEVRCHGCAQVVVHTFLELLGLDAPLVSMAASPFAAGMALTGHTCGAIIGGQMVLGLVFGRRDIEEGMPGILKGIKPMRRLMKDFAAWHQGQLTCREITGTDLADPAKAEAYFGAGGLERCANIMAQVSAAVGELLWEQRQRNQG